MQKQRNGAAGVMLSKFNSALHRGYRIYWTDDNRLAVTISHSAADSIEVKTTRTLSDVSKWYHIVITYDGSGTANGVNMFINNVIQGAYVLGESVSGVITNSSLFVVGAQDGPSYAFRGYIDETSVFSKALTQNEISALYHYGEGSDLSKLSIWSVTKAWWRFGDGDTFPDVADNKPGSYPGVIINGSESDIQSNVPWTGIDAGSYASITPGQMFDNGLDVFAEWPSPYILDKRAYLADPNSGIKAGMLMHLNLDGKYEKGITDISMPVFALHNQSDYDVEADTNNVMGEQMAGLLAISGIEIETTEFVPEMDYNLGTQLVAATGDDVGKVAANKGNSYDHNVIGVVSRTPQENKHGRMAIRIIPCYLPKEGVPGNPLNEAASSSSAGPEVSSSSGVPASSSSSGPAPSSSSSTQPSSSSSSVPPSSSSSSSVPISSSSSSVPPSSSSSSSVPPSSSSSSTPPSSSSSSSTPPSSSSSSTPPSSSSSSTPPSSSSSSTPPSSSSSSSTPPSSSSSSSTPPSSSSSSSTPPSSSSSSSTPPSSSSSSSTPPSSSSSSTPPSSSSSSSTPPSSSSSSSTPPSSSSSTPPSSSSSSSTPPSSSSSSTPPSSSSSSSAPWADVLSLELDGVNEAINAGQNYAFEKDEAFSFSMWIKIVGGNSGAFFGKGSLASGAYQGWYDSGGRIWFALADTSGNLASVYSTSSNPVDNEDWHHIVFTYDGSESNTGMKVYMDGAAEAVTLNTDALSGSIVDVAEDLTFGLATGRGYHKGFIDEIAVYDKDLSLAEVQDIHNSGCPTDVRALSSATNLQSYWYVGDYDTHPTLTDKAGAIDATAVNTEGFTVFAPCWNPSSSSSATPSSSSSSTPPSSSSSSSYWGAPDSKSAEFDGVNECLTVDYGFNPWSASMTISAWIKPDVNDTRMAIMSKRSVGDTEGEMDYIFRMDDNGKLEFVFYPSGGSIQTATSSTTISTDTWHHVIVTHSNATGDAQFYIDGVADDNNDIALTGSKPNGGRHTRIGRDGEANQYYFNGNMNEISYWNKVLTAAEVTELYNDGCPGNIKAHSAVSNCVSWWRIGDSPRGGFPANIWVWDEIGSYDAAIFNMGAENAVSDVPCP